MKHHQHHHRGDDSFGPPSDRPTFGARPRRGGPHGFGGFPPGAGGFGPGRGGRPDFVEGFFGPMGPGGRRGGRRGPGRGRRGDVRNAILALLAEAPMNGYQIISAISERTQGLWEPSAGSVYPALGLLQDEGLVESTEVEGRKAFGLTTTGRTYVEENADELTEPWAKVAQPVEGYLDVRHEVGQLAMALHQVVHAGDAEQIKAARGILDEARKGIYRILAGDHPAS